MMETAEIPFELSRIRDLFYEPSEDSFLLLDALEKDLELIKQMKPSLCLEVGCGSGVIITSLATALGATSLFMATDINKSAGLASKCTASKNCVSVEIVLTDLVSSLLPRIKNQVDVLIFNPPYVVTPPEEVGEKDISASWAGGVDGREVIDRFLPYISEILSSKGIFYLVTIKENKPDEIIQKLQSYGLKAVYTESRRCGSEMLFILKAWHS